MHGTKSCSHQIAPVYSTMHRQKGYLVKQLRVAYLDPQHEQLLWTLFQVHTSYLPLDQSSWLNELSRSCLSVALSLITAEM